MEGVAQLLAGQGLQRSAGRMWAWLLICDPPEQTAAQLAEELNASRGTISDVARTLEAAGLIRRTSKRGDRREYFSIPRGATRSLMRARLPAVSVARRLMAEGIELLDDRPPEVRARVQEAHDVYAFFERELPALIDRFEAETQ